MNVTSSYTLPGAVASSKSLQPWCGQSASALVGATEIEAMSVAVPRLALGRFERSVLLKGLRGVGKTVLLNEFGRIAATEGWVHAHLEATEDVALRALLRRSAVACCWS